MDLTYNEAKTIFSYIVKEGYKDLPFLVRIKEVLDENDSYGKHIILLKSFLDNLLDKKLSVEEALISLKVIPTNNDILRDLTSEDIDEKKIESIRKQIDLQKNILFMKKSLNDIETLTRKLNTMENVTSYEELKENFQIIANSIVDCSIKIMEEENESSVDLDSSNADSLEELYNKHLKSCLVIPSFVEKLDNHFDGGFHAGRLYTFVLPPGHGKSMLMLGIATNILENMTESSAVYNEFVDKFGNKYKPRIFYFTFENSIKETLDRIASRYDCKNNPAKFARKIKEITNKSKCSLDIKYSGAGTMSPMDILSYIESQKILGYYPVAIFVDYLLLLAESFNMEKRHALGYNTKQLKNIAVSLNIPVITATQLKKSAYKKTQLDKIDMSDTKESGEIIDNTDVLVTGYKTHHQNRRYATLNLNIDKQRGYISGVRFEIHMDFSRMSFIDNLDLIDVNTINEKNSDYDQTFTSEGLLSQMNFL